MNRDRAGGWGAQGEDGEPKKQGDTEGSEDHGGGDDSGDRGIGGVPEGDG